MLSKDFLEFTIWQGEGIVPEMPLSGEEPTHVSNSGAKFIPGRTPQKSMELCQGFFGPAVFGLAEAGSVCM